MLETSLEAPVNRLASMNVEGPARLGMIVVAAFFLGLGSWMLFAPIESAAIAAGFISVESKRKSIQHLEGGIVRSIEVRDGDEVEVGDVLLELDRVQTKASQELILGRYHAALAWEARLLAERDGLTEIDFGDKIIGSAFDSTVIELIAAQKNIFEARRQSLQEHVAILNQRIDQFGVEASGLNELLEAQDEELSLIRDEIQSYQKLFSSGMIDKTRMRALQREEAALLGERSQNIAAIARIGQNKTEAQLDIKGLHTKQLNEVVQQLRDVQSEIADLSEQLDASQDVLARTDIRAPISGVIVGSTVFTIGGVVAPGETLMEIVPRHAKLIVEAQVNPNDIDIVREGLEAQIHLSALSRRKYKPLPATVTNVSADRLLDKHSGAAYYLVHLDLNLDEFEGSENLELFPGMQAEVIVLAEARTPFEYFFDPLFRSFNRALRED